MSKEVLNKICKSTFMQSVLSVLLACAIASIFVLVVGKSPIDTFYYMFRGAFGSPMAIANTLNKAVPLILSGVAAAIAFKAGMLNLGIEGQIYMGGLFSMLMALNLPEMMQNPIGIVLCILAGMLGGGLWGMLVGVFKVACNVSEVIVAILLNYISVRFVSYMINYPLKSLDNLPETMPVPEALRFSTLMVNTRLTTSIFLVVAIVIVIHTMINQSTFGYKLRAVGDNTGAAQGAGIRVSRIMVLSLFLSGAIGGVIGATETLGTHGRMYDGFVGSVGFSGLAVAVLGYNNPYAIIPAGLLLGAMESGARMMSIRADLSTGMVTVIQALIIFCVATPKLLEMMKWKGKVQ